MVERLIGDLEKVDRNLALLVQAEMLKPKFVPYAFGALPFKAMGDVIGHPAHGLIGAVTVAPQGAELSQARVVRQPLAACENPLVAVGDGLPRVRRSLQERLVPGLRVTAAPDCASFVMVPQPVPGQGAPWPPMWAAHLTTKDKGHRIRQFTLFWQDGLNLRDSRSGDRFVEGQLRDTEIVEDCKVCYDSYDLGEKAVSYRSEPFHVRLRGDNGNPVTIDSHYDLNAYQFGHQFFRLKPGEGPARDSAPVPVLRVAKGEEIVVHVVHPGGRARQRAFVTVGQDYDDLFPGSGFARAALLAPGKAVTASILTKAETGCYLWFDGPTQTRGGGVWGLLDVVPRAEDVDNATVTSCARPAR